MSYYEATEKDKKKKKGLKPGMRVQNTVSGKIGEVYGIGGRLYHTADWCIMVRRRMPAGRYSYPIWRLSNITVIKQHHRPLP